MGEEREAQMEPPELLAHRSLPSVEHGHPGETERPVPHHRTVGSHGARYTRVDGGKAVEQPLSSLSEEEVLKRKVDELTAQLSAVRYVTRLRRPTRRDSLFRNRFRRCHPPTPNTLAIHSQGGAQCAGKQLGLAVRPLPLRQGGLRETTPTARRIACLQTLPCSCHPGLRSLHPHPS